MSFNYKDYSESLAVKNARDKMNQNQTYKESAEVINARNSYQNLKAPSAYSSQYADRLKSLQNQIDSKSKFSYDVNTDPLYQQYKEQYINLGKLAMNDTMGQAAALTGGYGNSYAQAVGNQAYQQYLTKLNDVVPQLYGMAMDKHNMDVQSLYNRYNMYNDAETKDYSKYRDAVADYQANRNFLYGAYNDARNLDYTKFADNRTYYTNAYNNERSFDYGQYSDAYNRAFQNYQQQVSENQWAKQYALQQAQLNEQIRANKASEAISRTKIASGGSGSGGSTSKSSNLKAPTSGMLETALSTYATGGEAALDKYVSGLNGYDTDLIYAEVSAKGTIDLDKRTYTKTKDTINGLWGIDHNDIVKDQYGNTYRIDELPEDIQQRLTYLKEGQAWNFMTQGKK